MVVDSISPRSRILAVVAIVLLVYSAVATILLIGSPAPPHKNPLSSGVVLLRNPPLEAGHCLPSPAAMGISALSWGENPNGGNPTSSVEGTANVSSLAAKLQGDRNVTLQLNVNLDLATTSHQYVTYWLQDIAVYNTANASVSFGNNIWNLSSPSIPNGTLTGNGWISTYTTYNPFSSQQYYWYSDNLTYANATDLVLRIDTSVEASHATVDFFYGTGTHWKEYDHVTFTFAPASSTHLGASESGLVWGGDANGNTTYDQFSNVTMQLLFFNGNNYQVVPAAQNFGGGTAESVWNADVASYYYSSNGVLFARMNNGTQAYSASPPVAPDNCGLLWNESTIATVNMTIPISSGYVVINGTPYSFQGGGANVTLFPGQYSFSVIGDAGQQVSSSGFVLRAGQSLSLVA